MSILIKIKDYFVGVYIQAKRVRWLLGRPLFNAILVTIIFSVFFAALLAGANELIFWMLKAIGMNS